MRRPRRRLGRGARPPRLHSAATRPGGARGGAGATACEKRHRWQGGALRRGARGRAARLTAAKRCERVATNRRRAGGGAGG
eukprot:4661205-Prymnesium_polylepis.1